MQSSPYQCQWCGLVHSNPCPRIKAVEYWPNGTTKRVELFAPNDYGPAMVKWPENWPLPFGGTGQIPS